MKKTFYLVSAMLLLVSGLQAAGFKSSAVGTTGGSFFNFGAGARAIAMGGAYTAAADDASAAFWNPAGLVLAPRFSMMVMHSEYLAGISLDHSAFAYSDGKGSAFAVSLGYMNGGKSDRTDIAGADLGSFSPKDYSGSLSYASSLADGDVIVGGSAKFLRSTIVESADAWAFDAGVISKHKVMKGLKLAAVVQNLGPEIKFDKAGDPLPLIVKLGSALNVSEDLLLSADLIAPRGNTPYGAVGAEMKSVVGEEGTVVSLRAGLNTLSLGDIAGLSGLSAGAGIAFSSLSVDYALVPFGELGLTHRLSLSLKFGNSHAPERLSSRSSSEGFRSFNF
jgi:hypothetical protein